MTLFSKVWKWLDNLFFGRRRILIKIADSLRSIEIQMESTWETYLGLVKKAGATIEGAAANMSAATQVLTRAQGAFERSDMAFAEIGSMADKMKAREAALEEALISIGKLKVEEAKVKALEAEELKKDLEAKPYDSKF